MMKCANCGESGEVYNCGGCGDLFVSTTRRCPDCGDTSSIVEYDVWLAQELADGLKESLAASV